MIDDDDGGAAAECLMQAGSQATLARPLTLGTWRACQPRPRRVEAEAALDCTKGCLYRASTARGSSWRTGVMLFRAS